MSPEWVRRQGLAGRLRARGGDLSRERSRPGAAELLPTSLGSCSADRALDRIDDLRSAPPEAEFLHDYPQNLVLGPKQGVRIDPVDKRGQLTEGVLVDEESSGYPGSSPPRRGRSWVDALGHGRWDSGVRASRRAGRPSPIRSQKASVGILYGLLVGRDDTTQRLFPMSEPVT